MRKIPTLYQRNYDTDQLIRPALTPGLEWVLSDYLTPTEKHDGTACRMLNGQLYKRFDLKAGRARPPHFEPAQDAPDAMTGHFPGWVPIGDGPDDKWHREAWTAELPDGTYELVGPKVQSNPYNLQKHILIAHGSIKLPDCPLDFELLRVYLSLHLIEGVVFWYEDKPLCKVKRRDYGLQWPIK